MSMTPEEFLEQYLEPQTLPEFMGNVTKAAFTTDARVRNGNQMLLIWTVETSMGEQEVRWGVGDINQGWRSVDGGKTLDNSQGKKLNQNCRYFKGLLTPVAGFGLGNEVQAAGGAYKAETWVGTTWQFGSVEENYGGEIGRQAVRVVTEYLGGFGTSEPTAVTSASNTSASLNGNADYSAALSGLSDDERASLKAAASDPGISSLADWAMTNLTSHFSDPNFLSALSDPAFRTAAAGA